MYIYIFSLFIYMHWEREGRLVEPKYSKTRIFEGLGVMPVMPRPKLVTVQDWARDVGEAIDDEEVGDGIDQEPLLLLVFIIIIYHS
jgi:hypothetical protein